MELYDTGGEARRDLLNFTAFTSLPTNSQSAITLAQESAHPVPHHNTIRRGATFTYCEPAITASGLSAVRADEGFRLEAAMANVGQTWTEDRIELLTKLWREGLSASQIAAELGGDVSRNSVLGKANRLELVRNEVKGAGTRPPRKPDRLVAALQVQAPSPPGPAPASAGNREQPSKAPAVIAASGEMAAPRFKCVTLMQLRESMCRWPLGDPATPEFRFCGARAGMGLPYCGYHAQIAYQPASERKRLRA